MERTWEHSGTVRITLKDEASLVHALIMAGLKQQGFSFNQQQATGVVEKMYGVSSHSRNGFIIEYGDKYNYISYLDIVKVEDGNRHQLWPPLIHSSKPAQ